MTRRERMAMDGRNPYGSRGGYVVSSRRGRRRGDRGMPDYNYGEDMRMSDMRGRGDYNSYPPDMRGRMDYAEPPRYDMRGDYNSYPRMDGHYPTESMGREYYPVEAMGHFRGYYGMGDYGRRDMRGGSDYGRMDYGYDYGDYGETLSEKELEDWCKKLKEQLDEREKQMFSKENIMQKAKQSGRPMENFGEKELEVATLMVYTDYKNTIGQNIDMAIRLAFDWLNDKDVAVKGAEKLAVYYDCIVMGE